MSPNFQAAMRYTGLLGGKVLWGGAVGDVLVQTQSISAAVSWLDVWPVPSWMVPG
jgi:hypothetical protein